MMDGICSFSILAILGICNRISKISMDDHLEKIPEPEIISVWMNMLFFLWGLTSEPGRNKVMKVSAIVLMIVQHLQTSQSSENHRVKAFS